MKVGLFLTGLAALVLGATTVSATITFDGSPGTAAPPSTLGGYSMTSFGDDTRSIPATVSSAPGPNGDVSFSPSLTHYEVGSGWATWSHGYTGDVYMGGTSVTMTMPSNTLAFYFYSEPNVFATFSITATADDGTTSGPISVQGHGGAKYFGFYATGGDKIASISVSIPSTALGFAVGDFGIYQCTAPTISVSLSPTLLWPPNHQYADVAATVVTTGSCTPLTVILRQVTSNEPDNGDDDGNTVDDISGASIGTADYSLQLRAERSSSGTGRIYTVTYKVTDALGNEAFASATVSVPISGAGLKPVLSMNEWDGTILSQNQPNPVTTTTAIPFRIPQSGEVDIAIHNIAGSVVRTLHLGELDAGAHSATWDGLDESGQRVPAGQYIYRLVGVECGCATSKSMNVVH